MNKNIYKEFDINIKMNLEDSTEECWECNFSEYPINASERVDLFDSLQNGLTPYELMYGVKDEDTRYSNNFKDLNSQN